MTEKTPAAELAKINQTKKLISRTIIGVVASNVVLGFGYLIMLNGLATQGFDLETLKAERIALQKQVENADIALAIPLSIFALESDESIQEMPLVEYKDFLSIRGVDVAMAAE